MRLTAKRKRKKQAKCPPIFQRKGNNVKEHGQLVWLGFDVTAFTPATYQRRSLRRPCAI